MDTDDILKLLLLALFLIPGLFGKKKKKEENRQPRQTEYHEYEDPFKDFGSFENDDFSEKQFEEYQAPNSIRTEPIDIIPQHEGASIFTKEQIEAALASIAKQESKKNEIMQNEIQNNENDTNSNDDHDFLQDFEAQKALIYSEILTPKYGC
ncbi:MAG: hypothetical protein LBQ28_06975 [Prevotellaceae bacterium]|jgi:hypothetical protein|nr:hypothetical protein [Prevotellaceae bacterium]